MIEQTLTTSTGQRAFQGPPDDPDDGFAGPAEPVLVTSGLYTAPLPVAGRTVAEVRRTFSDRLDIDPEAVPVLDGRRVEDEATTLRAGETLAFVRYGGEKGARVA